MTATLHGRPHGSDAWSRTAGPWRQCVIVTHVVATALAEVSLPHILEAASSGQTTGKQCRQLLGTQAVFRGWELDPGASWACLSLWRVKISPGLEWRLYCNNPGLDLMNHVE